MNAGTSIRNANLGDLDAINMLLDELGGYHDTASFLFKKLPALINSPDCFFFVYEREKKVIGLAAAQIILELGLEHNTMLITYLIVNDKYRGKGVGRKLEQRCCELAIQHKCGRIQLHCAQRRSRARHFYQNLGYKESPKYFTKPLDPPTLERKELASIKSQINRYKKQLDKAVKRIKNNRP